MIRIRVLGGYSTTLTKLLQDEPGIEASIDTAVAYFQKNPDDTRVRNHALHGKMNGKWAFSVTDDIRIVYEWVGKTTVRFLAIGGHPTVYPRSTVLRVL